MVRTPTAARVTASRFARKACPAAALCGLLLGLAGCGLTAEVGNRQRVKVATIQMKSLADAMDVFRADMGRLPSQEEWPAILWVKPEGEDAEYANYHDGGYLMQPVTKDPWGNPYVYDALDMDEAGNVTSYRLRSYGPNKQDDAGEGDDIVYPEPVEE